MINRQKHKKTCGPAAICNAIQWSGYKLKYQDAVDYCKEEVGYVYSRGMARKNIRKILRQFDIKHKVILGVTFKDIDRELDAGNAVILQYRHDEGGHYTFIDHYTDKFYRAWNDTVYLKSPYRARKSLATWIRYSHRRKPYPNAIVIKG